MDIFDETNFEADNNDFEANLEAWREKMITAAIQTNYNVISENGIDPVFLSNMKSDELSELYKTLNMMIEYFEGEEEYEKCAVLVKEINKVQNNLSSVG